MDAVRDLFLPCLTVICWSYKNMYVGHTYVVIRWSYKELLADMYEAALNMLKACAQTLLSSCLQQTASFLWCTSNVTHFKGKQSLASACPMLRCVWRQQAVSALLLLFSLWVNGIPVLDECLCTATSPCYICVCALWNLLLLFSEGCPHAINWVSLVEMNY